MKTKKSIILLAICILTLGIAYTSYGYLLSPMNHNRDALFEIPSGNSIQEIGLDLKEKKLIRSVNAFKLFVKLNKVNHFQSGTYELKDSMSVREITNKITSGKVVYPDQVKVTFPEGFTILEMAEVLSKQSNYSVEEILMIWNSPDFVNKVISNYDFITDDIKETGITYPLNGYLFPATYFLDNKDVPPQDVAWMMLSKMESVLEEHFEYLDQQNLSVHELLTLASIIEYEARFDEDRPMISGVFHNRLNANMRLDSCATLEMALGVHKEIYTRNDIQTESPYNTYSITGLPIGPGNCPGSKSIEAALRPAKHDYYYFLSDIYGDHKTYYSNTLAEHNELKKKYLP